MKMESRFGIDDVFSVIKAIIVWGLIVFGSLEAVCGLLQVYGYEPSNHSLYALTGSFYNPGPYSGFLAMCLPLALHEWLEGRRIWKHLALVAWVLMLVVLPSGMSRSAWVAALVASGYVWAMHYPKVIARYWKAFLAGGLLVILLGIGAYHWKKDSADGRLLMWKIAFTEVPATIGVGWENVAGAYGEAQERYFRQGKGTPQEERVAGAPEYVFNEYLQVGIAWGVPVASAIEIMIIVLFSWGHRSRQYGVCGGLFSLAVFAFSSYPFQFLEFILAFLALLVACALGHRKLWVRWLALVLGIGLGVYLSANRPTKNARQMFEQAHALHKAGEWQASTDLLKETMKVSSDAMVLNIIGKNFQAMGQPKVAEHWFVRSTHRLPNRIYPYYLLAKLYAEHPDVFPKEKLEWAVRMVLEKEAKVESSAIRQMREEVKIMLEEKE